MIIPPTWNLPELIRVRLGQSSYGRQRAIVEAGHLLLVLHRPPGPDDRAREGILFWRSPAGDWQCNRGGPGSGALKRHVQSYLDLEAQYSTAYEAGPEIGELFDLLEILTPLVRSARNLHAALQTAREAIKDDPFLIEVRDLGYEVERNFELLHEDVRNAIHHRSVRKAEEHTRLSEQALQASHRLNILAALFFPLTAIAGIFGMNFAHGLDQHQPALFWLVFAVGCALGFGMKAWVLARPKPPTAPSPAKKS